MIDPRTADLRTYSPQQLAYESNVSARRWRQAIKRGELPAYTCGGRRSRIVLADAIRWIRSQRKQIVPPARPGDHAERRAAEVVERLRQREART